eukprot:181304-Hanusia_phi.AAC.1
MPKSKVTINTKLRRVIHAYTKTVVKKKAAGIMDVQEGRTNISLPEYREVTRIMREMRPRQSTSESGNTWVFGWTCVTLLWGLICRSESLDVLHLEHIMYGGTMTACEYFSSVPRRTKRELVLTFARIDTSMFMLPRTLQRHVPCLHWAYISLPPEAAECLRLAANFFLDPIKNSDSASYSPESWRKKETIFRMFRM